MTTIAQFYSDLSIDGRFASLPKNTWDLRTRQTVASTVVDTDSLSVEDEEDFVPADDDETEEEVVEETESEERIVFSNSSDLRLPTRVNQTGTSKKTYRSDK